MLEDENKEANDFSHYFDKKQEDPSVTAVPDAVKKPQKFSKLTLWGLVVVFVLAAILIVSIIFSKGHGAKVVVPDGYRLVNDHSGPPKLEKIK